VYTYIYSCSHVNDQFDGSNMYIYIYLRLHNIFIYMPVHDKSDWECVPMFLHTYMCRDSLIGCVNIYVYVYNIYIYIYVYVYT